MSSLNRRNAAGAGDLEIYVAGEIFHPLDIGENHKLIHRG